MLVPTFSYHGRICVPTETMWKIMELMADGWKLTATKDKWSLFKGDVSQKVNARTATGMLDRELIYRTCGPYKTVKSYSLTRYGREILKEES